MGINQTSDEKKKKKKKERKTDNAKQYECDGEQSRCKSSSKSTSKSGGKHKGGNWRIVGKTKSDHLALAESVLARVTVRERSVSTSDSVT